MKGFAMKKIGEIGERTDMILGHEAVGIVEKVSSEVKDFKPGNRVVVPAIPPTGILWKHRLVTPCTLVECWQAGNSLTLKTVYLQNTSM